MKISSKELEYTPCIHQGISCSIYRLDTIEYKTPVLLKIFMQKPPSSREISKFANEFEITKGLNTPEIQTVYELGEIQGKPFIILEYIEGTTLKEAFVKQQNIEDILAEMISATKAMMAILQLNIIHRNITSDNIIVNTKK